ncbi:MAG: dienelactone hydrolase family protein [Pseudomonadota bacterium]
MSYRHMPDHCEMRRSSFSRRFCRLLFAFFLLQVTACQGADEPTHKVVWQRVRDNGLVATYLRPKGEEKHATVLVVGGSEGGIQSAEQLAYRFAERGWAAMAVAYFGMDGLPSSLANIPLEYFDSAIDWLQQQPHLATNELTVVGTSRGAELALLLASHNAAINRVVAFAPSAVLWGRWAVTRTTSPRRGR